MHGLVGSEPMIWRDGLLRQRGGEVTGSASTEHLSGDDWHRANRGMREGGFDGEACCDDDEWPLPLSSWLLGPPTDSLLHRVVGERPRLRGALRGGMGVCAAAGAPAPHALILNDEPFLRARYL